MWARDGSTAGGRVRVVPQLIRAGDDRQLWSGHYDRRADELFDVQSEIATTVSAALNLTLSPSSAGTAGERPTRSLDAYEAYPASVWPSIRLPTAARATKRQKSSCGCSSARWRSIRSSHWRTRGSDMPTRTCIGSAVIERSNGWPRRKAAIDRAQALQPDLAWGRLALGNYLYTRTEYESALRELESVRGELAGEASFLMTTGAIKRRQGKMEEGLAYFRRAVDLDPRSAELLREVGIDPEPTPPIRRRACGHGAINLARTRPGRRLRADGGDSRAQEWRHRRGARHACPRPTFIESSCRLVEDRRAAARLSGGAVAGQTDAGNRAHFSESRRSDTAPDSRGIQRPWTR